MRPTTRWIATRLPYQLHKCENQSTIDTQAAKTYNEHTKLNSKSISHLKVRVTGSKGRSPSSCDGCLLSSPTGVLYRSAPAAVTSPHTAKQQKINIYIYTYVESMYIDYAPGVDILE